MAKPRIIWKLFLTAITVSAAAVFVAPTVMAHGGGHCGGGGGHCGGSHFGGGAHISCGSHFTGGGHCGHISLTHTSTSHLSSSRITNVCSTHESNSGKHGFSIFGRQSRTTKPVAQTAGIRAFGAPNCNLEMPEIAEHAGSPSPNCSVIVRSEPHVGFFAHIHRMFGGNQCELQNIHTEIMPRMLTEVPCSPAPAPCIAHQIFDRENLTLNHIASQSKYLRSNAIEVRFLNQSNRNLYTTKMPDNYFSVNVDNTLYPASELDSVIVSGNPDSAEVDVVAENEVPTFSGLSYMLPNPGGILNIYFSYESSINNFLQLHKASFLAAAMHQLI